MEIFLEFNRVSGAPKNFWGVVLFVLVGGDANLCVEAV